MNKRYAWCQPTFISSEQTSFLRWGHVLLHATDPLSTPLVFIVIVCCFQVHISTQLNFVYFFIAIGLVAIPGGVGGFLVGSYLIKRFTMPVRLLLQVNFILSLICLSLLFAFAVQCDTASLVGVTNVAHHQRFVQCSIVLLYLPEYTICLLQCVI